MEHLTDRGILYGDGFFETIAVFEGKALLLPWHFKRIVRTALYLRMILPDDCSDWEQLALKIIQSSNFKTGRLRLTFIRDGRGLYLPESNHTRLMAEFSPHVNLMNHQQLYKENIEFAVNNYAYPSPLSQYKLISKSDRVLLALENQDRTTDDLIVCDAAGNISEAIASNIFFMKNDTSLSTPSLDYGCLDGVMRRTLIDLASHLGVVIEEEVIHHDDLTAYQSCFLTNAIQGIVPVSRIGKWKFNLALAQNFGENMKLLLNSLP